MIYEHHFDGAATDAEPRVTMKYNTAGERVEKDTPSATTRSTRGQGQLLAEYDGGGTLTLAVNRPAGATVEREVMSALAVFCGLGEG